jgi:hypothetical protein
MNTRRSSRHDDRQAASPTAGQVPAPVTAARSARMAATRSSLVRLRAPAPATGLPLRLRLPLRTRATASLACVPVRPLRSEPVARCSRLRDHASHYSRSAGLPVRICSPRSGRSDCRRRPAYAVHRCDERSTYRSSQHPPKPCCEWQKTISVGSRNVCKRRVGGL